MKFFGVLGALFLSLIAFERRRAFQNAFCPFGTIRLINRLERRLAGVPPGRLCSQQCYRKVVQAGYKEPCGNLLVMENNGYQTCLRHLEASGSPTGQILEHGKVVALSVNSTGALLYYGVKHKARQDGNA